jgi:endonuclease/exonuclease/phosphatase family metal-dependent hydrolase
MTWNINGALGRNPRFDLALVVDYVQRHAPDIVALQEVDSRRARAAGMANPFDVLRDALGTHGTHAHAISTADGDYGQALISRWPLTASSVHDLSYPEREPRRAISAEVATPAGLLHVVATHLGLSLRERSRQAQTLLGLVGSLQRPTVVMGDFNDWLWRGSVRRALRRVLPRCTAQRTFPAFLPLFRLDCIYVSDAVRLVRARTDPSARSLSDHLPVIVEIEL